MDPTDLIKERIPIVELISESLQLKKAGRNFKGLCPFHGERTPSFVVSPDRQIWHCFGCQKGGDIFTFLMELDRIEFAEALRVLAARVGVKLQSRPEATKNQALREQLLAVHHLAQEYYHYLLTQHRIGQRARNYLKDRGITDAIIKTFSLGFAPQAWDNLATFLHKKGYANEILSQSGLIMQGRHLGYDRFRGRIMFPIKNYRGETIAFSGRVLDSLAKEAKYINSPETPLYIKGETLYGLDITRDAIRKNGAAIVVEGEFDVLSSFQVGVSNVVAIKGSAFTEAQVRLLRRYTERIILSLDADVAGDAAARRGIDMAERDGLDIRVVVDLVDKDPDEVARKNPEVWKKAVQTAVPFYDFVIKSALKRYNGQEAFGKRKISEELLPMLAKIQNTIVQAHYIKAVAVALELTEEKVAEALRKLPQAQRQIAAAASPAAVTSHETLLEEYLLALTVQSPQVKETLSQVGEALDPSDFTQPAIKKIFIALLDYSLEHNEISSSDFAKTLPQELVTAFDRAYLLDMTAIAAGDIFQKELTKTVRLLQKELLRRKINAISTDIAAAEKKSDGERVARLHQEMAETMGRLKRLP